MRLYSPYGLLGDRAKHTSYHSWAALIIGWRYGTPFAASTSTSLSIHIQPAQADDGRGQLSSYTGSLAGMLSLKQCVYTAQHWNIPPPPGGGRGGGISTDVLWKKNMKREQKNIKMWKKRKSGKLKGKSNLKSMKYQMGGARNIIFGGPGGGGYDFWTPAWKTIMTITNTKG